MIGQTVFFLFLITLFILSKENIFSYLKMIWHLKILIIGLILLKFFFSTSWEATGIAIFKIINVLLLTQFMMKNIKLGDITDALTMLLSPLHIFGLNPSKYAFSLSLSIHFIPLILTEANKIWKSLASRGILLNKITYRKKIKMIKVLLTPLFTRTITIADKLADTMSAKLCDISIYKRVEVENWNWRDSVVLTISLYVFLIIIIKGVIL
jgi:energy-coupling factor transporter transmembrane protein EcfT